MADLQRFHYIAIGVAFFILLAALIVIGLMMTNSGSSSVAFPPLANSCPDFWLTDMSGNCVIPGSTSKNTINVPPGSLSTLNTAGIKYLPSNNTTPIKINFSDPAWETLKPGRSGICSKQDWAGIYGVYWDGVTNYNQCKKL